MIPSSISPSVTLCYEPVANVTRGIFEIAEIPYNRFGKLQSEYSSCGHPLLLPLIALEILVELTISENVLPVEVTLREIERETGYELNSATDNASLHFTGNLTDLTRRLGAAQSKMYFAIGNLRAPDGPQNFSSRSCGISAELSLTKLGRDWISHPECSRNGSNIC
jgi:hypothetical protein